MRALMHRLAATLLVALLAAPGEAPCRPCLADERGASSSRDAGMNAPPGPTASAVLSVAPAALATPLSPSARVAVAFYPIDCGRQANRAFRPAVAVKAAPTILRI